MHFELPPLAFLVIPLAVAATLLGRWWIYAVFLVFAPWQASSVLDLYVGGYGTGLQAGYFCLLLVVIRLLIPEAACGPLHLVDRRHRWLYLFVAYAVVSAALLPWLFAGQTLVLSPRPEAITEADRIPLAYFSTHLTQPLYLLLGLAALMVAQHVASLPGGPRLTRRAFLASALVVGAVAVWEQASHLDLVAFPSTFFRGHPGYRQYLDLRGPDTTRLASVFSEPSFFTVFVTGAIGYGLAAAILRRRATDHLLLAGALVAAALSDSSTALLGLVAVVAYTAASLGRRGRLRRGPLILLLVVAGTLLIATTILMLVAPDARPLRAVAQLTIEKVATTSWLERELMNRSALINFTDTWGLGAGYGSARASTLVASLLGTVGLGAVAFAAWVVGLRRLSLHPASADATAEKLPFWYAFAGMLIAMVIAVPDLMYLNLWIAAGVVAARQPDPPPGPITAGG